MGYSFSTMLIWHGGDLRALRDRMKEYYRAKGYVQARGAEEADLTIRLYADAKHSWAIAVGDIPKEDECICLSRGLKMTVIRADNFDSDALLLTLTDGKASETVGFGEMEEEKPLPEETPMWDAMLETDEAKTQFSGILQKERVFSEEALTELAPLIGFREDLLNIPMDEDDGEGPKPFCVIRMKDKLGKLNFLADQDAPPAVAWQMMELDKIAFGIYPTGGTGKGLIAVLIANGFDAEQFEVKEALLRPYVNGSCWEKECWQYAEVRRSVTKSGEKCWVMKFPEAEIRRGVKEQNQLSWNKKIYDYAFEHSFAFSVETAGVQEGSTDLLSWLISQSKTKKGKDTPSVTLVVFPVENPNGGIVTRYPKIYEK